MAKKKKNKKDFKKNDDRKIERNESSSEQMGSSWHGMRQETTRSIWVILSFAFAVFFLMSSLGTAGVVGKSVFNFLDYLLGIGYFVLPIGLFMLAISFLKAEAEKLFGVTKLGGFALFFLSILGLIETVKPLSSGVIGGLISHPLVHLFDAYVTSIFLICLAVISTLVLFEAQIDADLFARIGYIFKRKNKSEESNSQVPNVLDESELKSIEANVRALVEKQTVKKSDGDIDKLNNDSDKTPKLFKNDNKAGESKKNSIEENLLVNQTRRSIHEFTPPPLSLLQGDRGQAGGGDVKANANIIKRTLSNFGIEVEMDEVSVGPSVTRYALKPAEGVKLSRIAGLQSDLALALAAHPIRIEAPIPGKSLVGIEVPNSAKSTVGLASLFAIEEYQKSPKALLAAIGRGVSGQAVFADVARMPHLLVAGATGSGKSVTVHAIINSLLFRNSPEDLKFIMVDPKRVELTLYNKIPHLLTPVITEAKKTLLALKWATKEMDRRYDVLESHSVRDIASYHKNIYLPELEKFKNARQQKNKDDGSDDGSNDLPESLPYIVIIIDELADLMQTYPRELESAIVRLAQMSRAVGIHLIISTQRPSVNVITGLIKANIPARIALQVSSQIDSRTILDMSGAEKLLGAGDMLYLSGEMSQPQRLQSAFISETEVKKVVEYFVKNYADSLNEEISFSTDNPDKSLIFSATLDNDSDEEEDELYEEARETVMHAGKASTSYLQRKLKIGYARAARLMDILEERGVIGPSDGAKPREVIGYVKDSGVEVEELE